MRRKLRMGMVGGGRDAFIGAVHRHAATLDGEIELIAGAFSADPKKSRLSGRDLLLDPARVYGSYVEMAASEAALPNDKRIDFVSIVTPNHMHFPVAEIFLKAGFNVVCDKPMTYSLAEARKLRTLVKRSGKVFALTHNYTGYPMVKEGRELVKKGRLGEIRKIVVEYSQDWLSTLLESTGQKQADWRTDPKRSGVAGCIGDIGSHAENLARYMTGLRIDSLCSDLTTFVPGRKLDDDGNILIRYKGGARGVLIASQISPGEENNLVIRIHGSKAGLEWSQQNPETLIIKYAGAPAKILRRGHGYLGKTANGNTRLPPGHPEGFIEGFANIYKEAAKAIREEVGGRKVKAHDYPDVEDGVYGMAFIETTVKSSTAKQKWIKFPRVWNLSQNRR